LKTEPSATGPWPSLLAGTLIIAAILRVYGLQSGLWFDEIVTLVESARLPLSRILTEFPGVNAHPFYSVLAHASIALFGDSSWALRLPAGVFGVATVWMVYVLGSRMIGRLEAWAGALVLATSYHHIWFSQNARGYTMLGFFALLSTYYLLRAGESARRRDYVFYALASAAGIYTHLTMAFIVAGQAAALVAARMLGWRQAVGLRWADLMWAWVGASLLSAIAYAPFAGTLVAHFGAEAPRKAAKVATGGWAIAEALRSMLSGAGVPATILGSVVAVIGGFSLLRRAPFWIALLVTPAVVTVVGIVGLGQPLRPRFLFFLAGAAAICLGHGVGVLARAFGRRSAGGAAVSVPVVLACTFVLVAASAVALPRNYTVPKQDFEGAVKFLEREEAGGVRVAAAGLACMPVDTYFLKQWPCLKSPADLDALTAASPRALVVYTLADYMDDPDLRDRLRAGCAPVRTLPATLGGGEMIVCDPHRQAGQVRP